MTKQKPGTEVAKITLRETALADLNKVAAGLAELESKYKNVAYDVTTTKGMDEAKKARIAIREPRYQVEHVRKEKKAELLQIGKDIDAEAKRITEELMQLEEPIDAQIKAEEQRKEDEKRAKAEAERARIERHQAAILGIREHAARAAGQSSEEIGRVASWLDAVDVSGQAFEEYAPAARRAWEETRVKLAEMHATAKAREDEAARLEAQRIENERIAAEQRAEAKRLAEQKAAIEAEARKAREKAEAEARRIEAEARAKREAEERKARVEREEADRKAAAERAEQDRIAREAREAEQRRLDEQAAELRRKQREAAEQAEREAEEQRRRARAEAEAKHAAEQRVRDAAPQLLQASIDLLAHIEHIGGMTRKDQPFINALQAAVDAALGRIEEVA